MKTVLIPWTGGLDSTYLVYKNIMEGNNVVCGYLTMVNNITQSLSEIVSREKNYPILSQLAIDKGVNLDFNYHNNIIIDVPTSNYILGQLPIVSIISGFIKQNIFSYGLIDTVQFGYIKDDSFFETNEDGKQPFKETFTNIFNTLKLNNTSYSESFNLEFPLEFIDKSLIFNELPKELLNNISYCEYPFNLKTEQLEYFSTQLINRKQISIDEITPLFVEKENGCSCTSCERMEKLLINNQQINLII